MRLPVLSLLLLVLGSQPAASAAPSPAARAEGKPDAATKATPRRRPSAVEKEARAFVESTSALFQPVSTAASEAAWIASTDVTAEHTGTRAGAEKTAAA